MKKYKVCIGCNLEKKIVEFTLDRSKVDGYDLLCKECKALKKRKWTRSKGKVYLDAKVGFKQEDAHLYVVHSCEICVQDFYPLRSNHKRCLTCSYVARDVVHHALTTARKYSKNWNAKVKPETVIEVSRRYVSVDLCCYCRRKFTTDNPKSLDHIVPVCLGGSNDSNNINISCLECNKSKAHLTLDKWKELCALIAAF